MSPPTVIDASSTQRIEKASTGAAPPTSTFKPKEGEPSKPLKLTGRLTFIKPVVATQRINIQHTMVNITKTMLECERKLRERIETRRRFEGSYVDPNDLDPSTGQGRTKKFIPSNIRKATMPLNCSDTVQKDNRCASASSAITTTLGKATIIHEKWKQEMATLA